MKTTSKRITTGQTVEGEPIWRYETAEERLADILDEKCKNCGGPAYARDDAGNFLCEDHHYKFSN